ncbi:hypothetical protein V8J38_11140 [Brevundimonas olei]|uniref:Tip attachment protein J domain-containing protein n=1 Tax=Brevundimonas olei TaxID=657642 RepID=A0ABZ2I9V1_9CAUL
MRTDLQARNEGARRFRNALLLAGGGFRRRWGTVDLAGLSGISRLETYGIGDGDERLLVFGGGQFQVRNLDGSLVQSLTSGVPWGVIHLNSMQVAIEDGKIIVTSNSFAPHLLSLNAGTWSIAPLSFSDGLNGAKLQPYWRFVERGVSLTPSGYSGSVSLTTSAAFFTAQHVGSRIRYTGVEIQITAVTNATSATGTVIGSLKPTLTLTVGSTAGFSIGQEVQGKDTQIRGVVSAVSGSTLTVQMLDGFTPFDTAEKLVGPTAETSISAVGTAATPAATTDWDEALISAARGYPGACALHRNRLLLGDFPSAQNVMAASATGDIQDFSTGTGLETDAIIERVGRETSLGLRHFGSTEQLLMFTEAGPYYVPEQVAAPLSPSNFELLKIGPEAAAAPQPLLVSEGMAFIERDSGRLMICIPTGNVRRSWEIADLSELAFHLMGEPVEIELVSAGTESDRLVTLLRSDGQIAPLSYRRSAQFSGWGLWTTTGAWKSLVVAGGFLFVVSARIVNGSPVYRLERFDPSAWADDMVSLSSPTTAVPLYANRTVGVWSGPSKIGEFPVNASGVIQGLDESVGPVQVGLDFPVTVETMPPVDQQRGLRPMMKITRADIDAVESVGFKVEGRDPSGWSGATVAGAVTPTTGVRRFRPLGRRKYPTITITQDVGGPLEIRSITMEVTS